MTVTPADEIAAEIWAIRRAVQNIEPLSRTRPHVFAEQKDEVARRLDAVVTKVRNTFGGAPTRLLPGSIKSATGRRVQVERRRTP